MILRTHLYGSDADAPATTELAGARPKFSSAFPALSTLRFLRRASEGDMPGFMRPFLPDTYSPELFGIEDALGDVASL
jgi:hypothetical protein